MEKLYLTVWILSQVAPVPLLILSWRCRHFLRWYALACLMSDLLMLALGHLRFPMMPFARFPIMVVGNVFLATEFVLLSSYYVRKLHFPRATRWVVLGITSLFCVHSLANGFRHLNLLGASVLCICYLVYALLGYYCLLRTISHSFPERSDLFWVNTGVLFYAAGTCLFFLFYPSTLSKTGTGQLFWTTFFLTANVTKNVFLTIAFASKRNVY